MSEIPKHFQDKLTEIGGLNPYGQPILKCVDGRTEQKWEAGRWCLKYPLITEDSPGYEYTDDAGQKQFVTSTADVPAGKLFVDAFRQVERGEERLIIERWRSAEFLATTGRFFSTRGMTTVTVSFVCRPCGSPVPHRPGTENMDIARTCPMCGSQRVSPIEEREVEQEELLPDLPAQGYYDFFMRLQNQDGMPHPPDEEALRMVNALWHYEHETPLAERIRNTQAQHAADEKDAAYMKRERSNALWGYDPNDYRQIVTSAGHTAFEKKEKHI